MSNSEIRAKVIEIMKKHGMTGLGKCEMKINPKSTIVYIWTQAEGLYAAINYKTGKVS